MKTEGEGMNTQAVSFFCRPHGWGVYNLKGEPVPLSADQSFLAWRYQPDGSVTSDSEPVGVWRVHYGQTWGPNGETRKPELVLKPGRAYNVAFLDAFRERVHNHLHNLVQPKHASLLHDFAALAKPEQEYWVQEADKWTTVVLTLNHDAVPALQVRGNRIAGPPDSSDLEKLAGLALLSQVRLLLVSYRRRERWWHRYHQAERLVTEAVVRALPPLDKMIWSHSGHFMGYADTIVKVLIRERVTYWQVQNNHSWECILNLTPEAEKAMIHQNYLEVTP